MMKHKHKAHYHTIILSVMKDSPDTSTQHYTWSQV